MDLTKGFSKTPVGVVLALITLVSVPTAFINQWGLTWFLFWCAAGACYWWWKLRFCTRTTPVFMGQDRTVYSNRALLFWATIPLTAIILFLGLLCLNIYGLDLWRKQYGDKYVRIEKHGTVNKYFGLVTTTTPTERTSTKRNQWIRWMWDGAGVTEPGCELLFIEGEQFQKKYQTFNLEVHDIGTKVKPGIGCAAFLVRDSPGDPWYRPSYRQIPCEMASDGNTRLFTLTAWNPEIGEKLWLFLCVASSSDELSLDTLNLNLLVQP